MTDLFAQQGISFYSSQMASTHPTATPAPIQAPKIDMDNAPGNDPSVQPVSASELNAPIQRGGNVPPSPDPQQISQSLAGAGNAGSAAAGAAPPQPSANSTGPVDLFQQEGIKADATRFNEFGYGKGGGQEPAAPPSITEQNQQAFNQGVTIPPLKSDNETGSELMPIGSNNGGVTGQDDQVAAYAQNQQQQEMQLAQTRFSPEQIQAFKNNPITFSEAFKKISPLGYALGDADADALKILPLAQKVNSGEALTPDEQNRIGAYLDNKLEISLRGFTWGGKVAYVGAQIPSWVAQFAMSGGVGKLLETGAQKAALISAEDAAMSAATRLGTQYATMMVPQYQAKYAEQRLNDISAVTDKGQLILRDAENTPAQSAMLAFGHASADIVSQMMAPAIGKYAVEPAAKLLSTPITVAAKNLSPEVTESLYQAWKAVQPNATVSRMFTSMGWAGMVEQLGANRVNQILNSSLDYSGNKHETFDQYLDALTPSKDQLLVEGGLIGMAGGISASTALATHFMMAKGIPEPQAQETVANMSALEKDQFVNKNMPLPTSKAPDLNEPTPAMNKLDQSVPASPEVLHMDEVLAQKNPSTALVAGQTAAQNAANPPLINNNQSFFNKTWSNWRDNVWPSLYAETINDVQPIENLSKEAIAKGAQIPVGEQSQMTVSFTKSTPEWIKRNWTTDTTTWDNDGNQVVTGKGMKAIYDDFDNMFVGTEPNMTQRHADFNDYLIARTLQEDAQKGLSQVTPDQMTKITNDMSRLANKYGQNFAYFQTFANELRDWDNRILHNLVTSGIKTQAWYDDVVAQRQAYSPLNRVVAEEYEPSVSMGGKGLAKDVSPSNIGSLKQRKGGSDLEIKDTFQSRLKNSAIIMQRSALNKLRADIAKFADYYPDKVQVKAPAIIREAVEHSYDPKLRTKLEQLAEHFGGEVKRAKPGDKWPQLKGNLGAYEPATKKTYLKPGTTEGTLTHEIGHMLDYLLDLKKQLLGKPAIKEELQNLAENRLRSKITLEQRPDGKTEFAEKFERNPQKHIDYVKNDDEILANMFDAWVNSPEQMERVAPKAKAAFEKIIDGNPELAALRQIEPSTNRATETIEKPMLDMRGPKGSIPVYLNGRRMYLDLSPELQKAFANMNPIQMGMVERFLGGIVRGSKRMLQFGATATPDFMLRHFYRAVFSSFLNAKGTSAADFVRHVTYDMPKAIFAVLGKNELYKEWASSSGALNTHLDLGDKNLAKLQKEMFQDGNMAKFLNPINWFHMAKEVSDYAPRIAVYEKAKRQGSSDLAAGLLSLEATGNYIRHGSLTKRINQYAPFFNDMVQGGDRFIRSLVRDPAGMGLRALATITMPQVILTGYYLFAADDQTRREYLNLPEWRRGVSMSLKIGDTWVPLPRAFSAGYVFGAIPEKIMIWMYGGPHAPVLKDFWLRQIQEAATSVSPVFDWTRAINPIFKSVLEDMTNYSFFRHGPIFAGDRNKVAPQNQFSDYTSETSKLLGKMFNFSPAMLDNTVYNMSGNTGKYALQFSDYVLAQERKAAGQPVNQKPERITDNPLYGGLLEETPRGTNTGAYQEFREHLSESEQATNVFKSDVGSEKAQFQHDNARTLAAYPPINAVNTQVMHIQHQIRAINQNVNLSGSDKEIMINRLKDQETNLIEGANQRYRLATGETK